MSNDPNNPYRKNIPQPQQQPFQPYIPPTTPQQPNQFRRPAQPNQFKRPEQSSVFPSLPHQPASFPSLPHQPARRTNVPEQPTEPIPPMPSRPDKTPLKPAPRRGAWSWYKRQKNIAKLGIGCLLVVVLLIAASAITFGVVTRTHLGPAAQATATTPKQVPTPTPFSGKIVTFGDGTHIVGKDIQPGTYRTRKASSNCYYARLSGLDGTPDEIIANNSTNAPTIITIDATDKGFQSSNCGTWTTDMSAITTSKTSFGDGIYLVGTDIQPGTYKSSGLNNCYLARLRGFGGTLNTIIANTRATTATVVTIAPTDKGFQSSNCGTWTQQ